MLFVKIMGLVLVIGLWGIILGVSLWIKPDAGVP